MDICIIHTDVRVGPANDIDGDEAYLLSCAEEVEKQARKDVMSQPTPLGPVGEVRHIKNAKQKAVTMYGRLNGVGAASNTAEVGSVALASASAIASAARQHLDLSV